MHRQECVIQSLNMRMTIFLSCQVCVINLTDIYITHYIEGEGPP